MEHLKPTELSNAATESETWYNHFRKLAAAAASLQSCPTLCSPPGSPVPGILQARTLEWVAISFSNAWKWKVKVTSLSRVWLLATPWTAAYQAPPPIGFSRQEYWSGVPLPSLSESWQYLLKLNISVPYDPAFSSSIIALSLFSLVPSQPNFRRTEDHTRDLLSSFSPHFLCVAFYNIHRLIIPVTGALTNFRFIYPKVYSNYYV